MKESDVLSRAAALVADFRIALTCPEAKVLHDIVIGILYGQSSLLSKIARAVADDENVKTVHRRLDLNLGRYGLQKPYDRAQRQLLNKVNESHLFIFDPSEAAEAFGKKIEGLALVRDAFEKPRFIKDARAKNKWIEQPVLGHPLRIAIAVSPGGDVVPVQLSLYSSASEFFLSRNDEYISVLDRGFDASAFIRHFCLLRQKFVVRVRDLRKYRCQEPFFCHRPNLCFYCFYERESSRQSRVVAWSLKRRGTGLA